MSADTPVIPIPYGDDPLRHLAALLRQRHRQQLPDLSRQVVLLPHAGVAPRFRRLLREQAEQAGFPALLPPFTGTPYTWAERFAPDDHHPLSASEREILLLDLLQDYPRWRREYGDWPLADSLLALFDELTLHPGRLPDDPAAMLRQIAGGNELSPFSDEAQLVYEIWRAWHERLHTLELREQTSRYAAGLARSLEQLPPETHVYLAGLADFTGVELKWIEALLARRRLTWLWHGAADKDSDNPAARLVAAMAPNPPTSDAGADFLARAFATGTGHLWQRAQAQTRIAPASPVRGRLVIHEAADAESEARAIDLQVRRWLVQGRRDIGIVTNDRRLARRVRALLERANIGLLDAAGWALSTTSAATVLARWLECLEQNFYHTPLLDLLKSPFLQFNAAGVPLGQLVPPFEQAVVRAQNISAGLPQYRRGLDRVAGELPGNIVEALTQLITRLQDAARPFAPLLSARARPAPDYLTALQKSLEILGLAAGLANDAAGEVLLDVIEEMRAAAARRPLRLSWAEFHQWLRRVMEQRRFQPPLRGRGVELMSFAESRLYRFDALIIAGALREHLPGRIGAPPYFNDGVRTELGLPSLARRYDALFHDFCRLLEAAPRVMVSLRREHDGERLAPSPWVERLRAFHQLAYGDVLHDPELDWLVRQPASLIVNRAVPLPTPEAPPAARLPTAMLPVKFSATSLQQLMDCPYRFFAASGLGLAPEEEVREEIEKADYGKHVHRILEAFHKGCNNLPGPWREPLTKVTRPRAEALLRQITQQVFETDLRRRFLARGWLHRWEQCIPAYLDWEQQRASAWKVNETEIKVERRLREGETEILLKGYIDRLDAGQDGLGILDYKTGTVPPVEPVLEGEKVQLPFYALLLEADKLAGASFLSLEPDGVKEKSALDGATLAVLRDAMRERLLQLKRELDAGAPLPAWGDTETCRVCEMEGLCRREMWAEAGAAKS